MNTYACWYQGLSGYCFEHPRSGWWFVPEQGQGCSQVHRHLQLHDFVFADAHEWQFEYNRCQKPKPALWQQFLNTLFPSVKPQSVAGLLFLPMT